jgi:uncharacterized membrane protein/mono/diheme cytochrome c family protein
LTTLKPKILLENLLIFWCGFTAIILVGGENLQLPTWLQVVGRLHPLLLHFPIVLLLLSTCLLWIRDEHRMRYFTWLLLIGANLAGVTVVAGIFLATEDYTGDALSWHKWTAISSLGVAVALYFLRDRPIAMLRSLAASLAVLLVLAGHFGAALTHGEDFLFAPLKGTDEQTLSLAEAEVFRDLVQPIFESKCIACHQEGKIKGELRLDLLTGIQKGGKSGALFVAGKPELSLLIQRIHLPLEEEEHMPPKNKLQLTEEELEILSLWVSSGGGFDQKVMDLPQEDPLFQLVSARFSAKKSYTFSAADPDDITALTTFFRKVRPVVPGSPALEVAYYGSSAFESKSLAELKVIQDQVVKLNLNRMPLQEVDLGLLTDFQNLESLSLNFTSVSGAQLKTLINLSKLEVLAISGNTLGEEGIKALSAMRQLKRLYLWQTGLNEQQKKELKKVLPSTRLDFGYEGNGVIYPLNPPKIKFESTLFEGKTEVSLSHPIRSTEIRYTLDGSLPDSTSSPVYKDPIVLSASTPIRARAFASGWIGSADTKELLIKKGITPTAFNLVSLPNPKYAAKGAASLFDGIKAKANHTTGDWLGFSENPLDLTLTLGSVQPKLLEVSFLLHEGAYIFPPQSLEVWIGNKGVWKKVNNPAQSSSTKIEEPRFGLVSIPLPAGPMDQIRLKAQPIAKLPVWHPGAGSKAWIFVDEILVH